MSAEDLDGQTHDSDELVGEEQMNARSMIDTVPIYIYLNTVLAMTL